MNNFLQTLSSSQHFAIILCVGAFLLGKWIQDKTRWVLLNPILTSYALIAALLILFDLDVEKFQQETFMIRYLLQIATVCLAVPLYRQLDTLKKNKGVILSGVGVGTLSAMGSIFVLCKIMALDKMIYISLLPKSVTTPIATGITQELDGIVAVTIIGVITTGVVGTVLCQSIFKLLKITDPVAVGLAIGTSAHALGTTKAIQIGEVEGAMSSLSIVVAGCMTVIAAPFLAYIF